jgi:hypothetical protein
MSEIACFRQPTNLGTLGTGTFRPVAALTIVIAQVTAHDARDYGNDEGNHEN